MVFFVIDFFVLLEVKVFEILKKDDLIVLGLYFGFDEEWRSKKLKLKL